MSVLISVPAYGHFDYVYSTVKSAFEYTPDCHVLVIDDCSPVSQLPSADYLSEFPQDRLTQIRYSENQGLTSAWNFGCRLADNLHTDYCVCGNSDLLYAPGWWEPMQAALDSGYALVGPVSNAPGVTNPRVQGIWNILPDYQPSDDPQQIAQVAVKIRGRPVVDSPLNGFCFAAKTDTWWRYAFSQDEQQVFDPQYRLTLNEDRLQKRWRTFGLKFGVATGSFVFHYRSVSRGDQYNQGMSFRKGM